MNNGQYDMKQIDVIVEVGTDMPLPDQLSSAAWGLQVEATRMGFDLMALVDNAKTNRPVITAKLVGNRLDGNVMRLRYQLTSETPGRVHGEASLPA